MSDDEFDNLPDLFSGISEAEWSRILDQPVLASGNSTTQDSQSQQQVSPRAGSTSSAQSTDYGDDNSLDVGALAEIDHIEAHALQTAGGLSSTTHGAAHQDTAILNRSGHLTSARTEIDHESMQSHYFMNTNAYHHALVTSQLTRGEVANAGHSVGGKQPLNTESSLPPAKKQRIQSSPERGQGIGEITRRLLEGYEEELSCPICCDLFVATHIGNPCGHSYCGDCGWQWFGKNKQNQCPICRAMLARSQPLIPNIAMDSLIDKHIEQLSFAGDEDWQPRGSKYKERAARKEKWKASAGARMTSRRTLKAEIRPAVASDILEIGLDGVFFLPGDDQLYTEGAPQEQLETADPHSDRRRRRPRRRRRN